MFLTLSLVLFCHRSYFHVNCVKLRLSTFIQESYDDMMKMMMMMVMYTYIQTAREGRCEGASARRKPGRRQRTRPTSSASAAGGTAAAGCRDGSELHLLPHQTELFVNELDSSFGSPYRRRPATTSVRPLITQVYT